MTSSSPTRVLAEAVRGLPDGLAARPTTTADLGAVTDLLRACDLASCGHTSTNVEEVRAEVAGPDCGWAAGSATIWRGSQLVGVLNTFDQLADGFKDAGLKKDFLLMVESLGMAKTDAVEKGLSAMPPTAKVTSAVQDQINSLRTALIAA